MTTSLDTLDRNTLNASTQDRRVPTDWASLGAALNDDIHAVLELLEAERPEFIGDLLRAYEEGSKDHETMDGISSKRLVVSALYNVARATRELSEASAIAETLHEGANQ